MSPQQEIGSQLAVSPTQTSWCLSRPEGKGQELSLPTGAIPPRGGGGRGGQSLGKFNSDLYKEN